MHLFNKFSTHSASSFSRLGGGLAAAALLAACGGGPALAGDVKSGPAPGDAMKIEAGDNFFKPGSLALAPGETVTVEVRNSGKRPHDWTSDELGVSTGVISPGEVFHATFTVPGSKIKYVCTLHSGMDGEIEVT